jgi:hypothetical protein
VNDQPVTIDIDLGSGPLLLWECGTCFALVMRERKELHLAWHSGEAGE